LQAIAAKKVKEAMKKAIEAAKQKEEYDYKRFGQTKKVHKAVSIERRAMYLQVKETQALLKSLKRDLSAKTQQEEA
jgi:hypothetical protein